MLRITFDNQNLRKLPVDPKKFVSGESRQVPNAVFSRVDLQPVQNPRLIAKSRGALELLGLPSGDDDTSEGDLTPYLSGNLLIPGSEPSAHCYCGHQFGSFAGQLGDGAAMYLGEVVSPVTGARWELQLKGAGCTPYSRSSDGRKVLRSSVREFLCSEAMHHLGVPTTRAGSCVTSDSTVVRDPFYDGRQINEKCTLVSRIAPNFFRFGSFEIFKAKEGTSQHDRAGPSAGNDSLKKQLLDHIVGTYFPAIRALHPADDKSAYRAFLAENVKSTAKLVALWQGCGFVHGVLNTDNMSIMGLTIDYGPFGFLETYDPDFTPNGSDSSARYTYEAQPSICKWNLGKLGEALAPLLSETDSKATVEQFDKIFSETYTTLMAAKVGLTISETESKGDDALVRQLFQTMKAAHTDFTDTFRALTAFREASMRPGADVEALQAVLLDCLVARSATPEEMVGSMKRKLRVHRLNMQPEQIEGLWGMLQQDPASVAEMFGGADVEAIRREVEGEKGKLDRLVFASKEIRRLEMENPQVHSRASREAWIPWVGAYVNRLQREPLVALPALLRGMQQSNPSFILRNWVAEIAIRAAELGDYSKVRIVLKMLETPYEPAFCPMRAAFLAADCSGGATPKERNVSEAEREFLVPPPQWASSLLCTCSS